MTRRFSMKQACALILGALYVSTGNIRSAEAPVVTALTADSLKAHNRTLESEQALKTPSNNRKLLRAAGSGDLNRVKAFLSTPSIDVNWCDSDGISILQWAVIGGEPQVVAALLERNDLDKDAQHVVTGKTALDVALERELTQIIALLEEIKPAGPKSSRIPPRLDSDSQDSDASLWGLYADPQWKDDREIGEIADSDRGNSELIS